MLCGGWGWPKPPNVPARGFLGGHRSGTVPALFYKQQTASGWDAARRKDDRRGWNLGWLKGHSAGLKTPIGNEGKLSDDLAAIWPPSERGRGAFGQAHVAFKPGLCRWGRAGALPCLRWNRGLYWFGGAYHLTTTFPANGQLSRANWEGPGANSESRTLRGRGFVSSVLAGAGRITVPT